MKAVIRITLNVFPWPWCIREVLLGVWKKPGSFY
jgi:hypothetical protein